MLRPLFALGLFFAIVTGLFAVALGYTAVRPAPPDASRPRVKLAVLVVFDQLRGDFPERWRPLFGPDGFARLQTQGITFTNCYYPHGTTSTGPGHAAVLTGTCADRHGIVNNNWFEGGADVYCAGSSRYELVPAAGNSKGKSREVGNPDRLLAETVADVLKSRRPNSRVFGLSLKDRSAILPTGKRPDGAYWFTGQFVTSTYYADRVHPWVERFNASRVADGWFGVEWNRVRSDIDYVKWSGPDVAPGEGKGVEVREGPAKGWSQRTTFPHPNTGGRDRPGKEYYESLANSPFGNDLLLQFMKECVTAERLGEDDEPDLLVVSFSSNDLIGHTWGPDSQEVLDVTLRSDALMAELFRFLDMKVGTGRYLVGVTADHGICPLVEASVGRGLDAKRVDPKDIQKAIENHLTARLGAPKKTSDGAKSPTWVETIVFPWVYLNPKALSAAGRTREEVSVSVAAFLRSHPDIGRAFTRADLQAGFPADDVVGNRARRSYFPPRCGDLYVVLKEWYLPSSALGTGTTHGAPYDYDAHVPLMFYGPGISGGASAERTTPQAMAAVFARWLGIRPPNKAEFPIPNVLEDKAFGVFWRTQF